jgi:hypothetical protein
MFTKARTKKISTDETATLPTTTLLNSGNQVYSESCHYQAQRGSLAFCQIFIFMQLREQADGKGQDMDLRFITGLLGTP